MSASTAMPERIKVSASFRDPAGSVFTRGGEFFRSVAPSGYDDYRALVDSHLAERLIGDGMLTAFREVGAEGGDVILALEKLPFITYPYEWCFSRFREAALLTLRVAVAALEHGMILKDASAFNVAVRGGRAEFIDHGSFTRYRDGEPWRAYRQFVAHFLGPLLLMKYTGFYAPGLLRDRLDGVEPGEIAALLPMRARLSLGTLIHIHLHARLQRACADGCQRGGEPRMSGQRLRALLETLTDFVAGLKPRRGNSEWGDYRGQSNYTEEAFSFKRWAVADFVAAHRGRCVDFGANTGEFSRIAAAAGAPEIIAADGDPAAVEKLLATGNAAGKIIETVQDLSNPSPGIGLFNCERTPFLERIAGADTALGLALIHHLRIGANWPLEQIVRLFADCAPAALVEFVPKSDKRVQQLLRTRPDICSDWELDAVAAAFCKRFRDCDVLPIPGSERVLLRLS